MSRASDQTITHVAAQIEGMARDLRRPRPSDQTPEESDARLSVKLAALAKLLRDTSEGKE